MNPLDVDVQAEWRLQELRRSYQRAGVPVVRPALGRVFVQVGDRLQRSGRRSPRPVVEL